MKYITIESMPKGSEDENFSNVGRCFYDSNGISVSIGNGCSCGSQLYQKTRLEIEVDIIPEVVRLQLVIWEGGDLYAKAKMVAEVANITNRLPLKAKKAYENKVRRFAWDCFHERSKDVDMEKVIQSVFEIGVYDGKRMKAEEMRKVIDI